MGRRRKHEGTTVSHCGRSHSFIHLSVSCCTINMRFMAVLENWKFINTGSVHSHRCWRLRGGCAHGRRSGLSSPHRGHPPASLRRTRPLGTCVRLRSQTWTVCAKASTCLAERTFLLLLIFGCCVNTCA